MLKRCLLPALVLATCFSCATTGQTKQAALHYKLGLARWESGQYQQAYVQFRKALEDRSDYKQAWNALGCIYMKWDDERGAEDAFTKAIDIDPDYSGAYNNRCLLEYRLKKYERAVSDCKQALSNPLYQTPENAFFNLGLAYYKLGKYELAVNAFRQATIRMDDFYPAYYQLALAYNAEADYGDAATALQLAVRLDPRFRGDMAKAQDAFQKGEGIPVGKEETPSLMQIFNY
ncbi:MAG: tetratricopeptide repeat protein [Nitrospiraceae bacterium]|nr:tetratricopeptide repeat protein [Nitrospiraceae bacterium]